MIWNPWRKLKDRDRELNQAYDSIRAKNLQLDDYVASDKERGDKLEESRKLSSEQAGYIEKLQAENNNQKKWIHNLLKDGHQDTSEIIRLRLLVDSWELKSIKLCHELDRLGGANG